MPGRSIPATSKDMPIASIPTAGSSTGRKAVAKGPRGLKRATDSLWYDKPDHYLGRQHRMSQVLMTPESEGRVCIKCFWSILQHDVKTFENRVFGMGTWDTLAEKREGEWRFASVYVDLWIEGHVPWVGEERALEHAAQGGGLAYQGICSPL